MDSHIHRSMARRMAAERARVGRAGHWPQYGRCTRTAMPIAKGAYGGAWLDRQDAADRLALRPDRGCWS